MIQIQHIVEIDEATGKMSLQLNILEREDANDQEREYAKLTEQMYLAIFDEMGAKLQAQDPSAKVTKQIIKK